MTRQGPAISNNAATWEEIDEHEGAGTKSLVKNRDILKWSNDSEERMENIMEFKKANGAAKTASGWNLS